MFGVKCFAVFALLSLGGCVDETAPVVDDAGPPDLGLGFPTSSAVTIIVEPSDKGAALVSAINGAKTSIDMSMYLLSSSDVIGALKARAKTIPVRVVLNAQFPPGTTPANPNTYVYTELRNAGVSVHWALPQFTFTHAKYLILDKTTAWIMTMNTTQSSPTSNREYLAVDSEPADLAELQTLFDGDFNNAPVAAVGPLVVSPDNSRDRLVQLMSSAQQTMDVEVESLSDTALVGAMLERKAAGVVVRAVIEKGPLTNAQQIALDQLTQAGVPVVNLGTRLECHAKSIVVDNRVAYVGSQNFTSVSLAQNREIGIVTTSGVKTIADTIAADFKGGLAF